MSLLEDESYLDPADGMKRFKSGQGKEMNETARTARRVDKAHRVANFLPVIKFLRCDVLLDLKLRETEKKGKSQRCVAVMLVLLWHLQNLKGGGQGGRGVLGFTLRCRFVGCMYWPSVRQSTPESRRSIQQERGSDAFMK